MKTWEYLSLLRDRDQKGMSWNHPPYAKMSERDVLAVVGADGWELVSVIPVAGFYVHGTHGRTEYIKYIFKRPMEDLGQHP